MYKTLLTSKMLQFLHVISDNEYNFLKGCHVAMLFICMFMVYLKTVSVGSSLALSMECESYLKNIGVSDWCFKLPYSCFSYSCTELNFGNHQHIFPEVLFRSSLFQVHL
jgi:hypothetical protein